MTSLNEICEQGRHHSLLEAIDKHDVPRVVEIMRDIAEPLPVEIVRKLADMLSLDRQPCDMGPNHTSMNMIKDATQ